MGDQLEERFKAREYDLSHPESLFELAPGDRALPEEWRKLGWTTSHRWGDPHDELCSACGWTTYDQLGCYLPRVRITHTRGNSGLWSLGSKWLIRDQPNDGGLGNEYITWKFLQELPGLNIPLVKEMQRLTTPEDPIQFTLISRAPGVELSSIWYTLSPEQKSGYRDQLVDVLKQLRQYTSPSPQKVNGDKLDDGVLICGSIHPPTCFKIGSTTEEWLADLSETIRAGISAQHNDSQDEELVEKKLQEIKDNFPSGAPYTLTHGDLNLTNIIVKDDKIQAIIDWEQSGYCPWWAERYLSIVAGGTYMNELFEGVWEKVQPEISDSAFKLIIEKIVPVRRAMSQAQVWHDHQRHGFWRPPFCKCKPTGGTIRSQYLKPFTHTVADWRNQSELNSYDRMAEVRDPGVTENWDKNTPTPKPSPASAPWFATDESPKQNEQ